MAFETLAYAEHNLKKFASETWEKFNIEIFWYLRQVLKMRKDPQFSLHNYSLPISILNKIDVSEKWTREATFKSMLLNKAKTLIVTFPDLNDKEAEEMDIFFSQYLSSKSKELYSTLNENQVSLKQYFESKFGVTKNKTSNLINPVTTVNSNNEDFSISVPELKWKNLKDIIKEYYLSQGYEIIDGDYYDATTIFVKKDNEYLTIYYSPWVDKNFYITVYHTRGKSNSSI